VVGSVLRCVRRNEAWMSARSGSLLGKKATGWIQKAQPGWAASVGSDSSPYHEKLAFLRTFEKSALVPLDGDLGRAGNTRRSVLRRGDKWVGRRELHEVFAEEQVQSPIQGDADFLFQTR
jgi:hypothetical protein